MASPDHTMNDYTAYGLRVRSAIPLPFAPLPDVPDDERGSNDEPDVTVRLGEAPAGIRGVVWEAAPGAFVLNVDGVARYLVTGGCDVMVEPRGGDDRDVGHFLAGPVFVALLRQRGVVAFRASAVATEAGAVLFAGSSGVGKSALLAALVARGHAMLADVATAVVPDGSGCPEALPAFPRIHLWADALDALGWRGQAGETVRAGVEKYPVPAQRFHARAPAGAGGVRAGRPQPGRRRARTDTARERHRSAVPAHLPRTVPGRGGRGAAAGGAGALPHRLRAGEAHAGRSCLAPEPFPSCRCGSSR